MSCVPQYLKNLGILQPSQPYRYVCSSIESWAISGCLPQAKESLKENIKM